MQLLDRQPPLEKRAREPILLRPGDRVRFRPVDRAEFDDIAARVATRTFVPVVR